METFSIEQARQIRRNPKIGVRSQAGENEEQRRWATLTIKGKTHMTASFKSRHLISAGKPGHMDDDRISARRSAVVVQNGGSRRRQIGIVIGIRIFPSLERTSQKTQRSQYRQNEMKAHRKSLLLIASM